MQTFIVYLRDIRKTAQVLDNKRLGKQRVEAIQIANILLGRTNRKGWRNHPAVKMWRGYETFLVKVYLKEIMDEWTGRGFKNTKCQQHYEELCTLVDNKLQRPSWLNSRFCICHRSNLIRKKPEYYGKLWPEIPDDLEYIWPEGVTE
jgi:hypothetical protein